jgi:ribosome biogenesis GTPase
MQLMSVALEQLGWTPFFADAFALRAVAGDVPGRVVLEHNHVFRVMAAGGEHLAESTGRMKHRAEARHELPAVGDWVVLRPDPAGGRGQIRAVLPRRSVFARKAAGRETEQQVVAANIDTVFVVFGLDMPVNPRSIDRYLVVARHSGTEPVVVLNKADLVDNVEGAIAEAQAAAGTAAVLAVSPKTGYGLDALVRFLAPGRTATLLGPSGVGKSTIVNHLVGHELLATGEVRDWDARGRHTSVHRQLVVRAEGGLIIDTPGMRELALWDTDTVADTFGDIAPLAAGCRFRDCRHETEPGCAVKTAAESGGLDPERLESFRKLQREQETVERLRDERALIDSKRHAKTQNKSLRALYKNRERSGT